MLPYTPLRTALLLALVASTALTAHASALTGRQLKNCDDKCYPPWKARQVAEKCKGDVVDCDYFSFGRLQVGKQCECPSPTPTSTATATATPSPSKPPTPASNCGSDPYEFCQSKFRSVFLQNFCDYGVESCLRKVGSSTVVGLRCKCPVSTTPVPACTAAGFKKCFDTKNFGILKELCPDGVSGCTRTFKGVSSYGVNCKCVGKNSPTPSVSPTPSTTPRPECISSLYNFCFPYWNRFKIIKLCPGPIESCDRLQGGKIVKGIRCKCLVDPTPTKPTPTPKPLMCPAEVDETTSVKVNKYTVDVKKSNACFTIVYSYVGQAYGLTVSYRGKVLRKSWINARVFTPLKLCIYGPTTEIDITYAIVPGKKIFFKVSCAYKTLTARRSAGVLVDSKYVA